MPNTETRAQRSARNKKEQTEQDVTSTVVASDEVTFAEAQAIAAGQRRDELIRKLEHQRERVAKDQETLARSRATFERTVALMVSSQPDRADWYEHPGALDRDAVRQAARLTTVALHRVMERNRRRFPNPTRRPR